MDAELEQLEQLAAKVRELDRIGGAIATDAAPGLEAEARATASAATDPSGTAWAQTKDGRAALPNAAAAIVAVVSGSTKAVITLVMKGPYVFHQRSKNKSAKRGLPRRVILPDAETGVPSRMRDLLAASAARVAKRLLRGGP